MGGSSALFLFLLLLFVAHSGTAITRCPPDQACLILLFSRQTYTVHSDSQATIDKITPDSKYLRIGIEPLDKFVWTVYVTTTLPSLELKKLKIGEEELLNYGKRQSKDILVKVIDFSFATSSGSVKVEAKSKDENSKALRDLFGDQKIVDSSRTLKTPSAEVDSCYAHFWTDVKDLIAGCKPSEIRANCTTSDCEKPAITPKEVTCPGVHSKLWMFSSGRLVKGLTCESKKWQITWEDNSTQLWQSTDSILCAAEDPNAQPEAQSKLTLYLAISFSILLAFLAGAVIAYCYFRVRCKSNEKPTEKTVTVVSPDQESTALGVSVNASKAERKSWRWSQEPKQKPEEPKHEPAAQVPKKDTRFINVTDTSTQSGPEKGSHSGPEKTTQSGPEKLLERK